MEAIRHSNNEMTSPVWLGDSPGGDTFLPGPIKLDAAAFPNVSGVTVTTTASAAAAATALTVTALSGPIPSGTVLYFGAEKYALVTANAAAAATSITVQALVNAIASGDVATFNGSLSARKLIERGVYVGRTYAERDAKAAFGPAADTDDECYILACDVEDALKNSAGTAVRHGKVIYENFLPGFAGLSTALKAKLRTDYETIIVPA